MTKSVFRTVNTVGPKELLPIYFILDDDIDKIDELWYNNSITTYRKDGLW